MGLFGFQGFGDLTTSAFAMVTSPAHRGWPFGYHLSLLALWNLQPSGPLNEAQGTAQRLKGHLRKDVWQDVSVPEGSRRLGFGRKQ